MKLSNMFVVNAIVALFFGISFVLAPTVVLSLYGMTQGTSEALAGQYFGVELIAIGLLTWFARNVADPDAQRAIIRALLISSVIGVVVSLLGTLSGVMNALGWSSVVIYLFLTIGYGYFEFMKPVAS